MGEGGSGLCCDLLVSSSQLIHTHLPSHFPLIHTTGFMPYHENLVQINELVPSSEKMLSVTSEPISLRGHCDSLAGPGITIIEVRINDP